MQNTFPKGAIVFGIPTYNEVDNISQLVKVIDKGLAKYFKGHRSIIVNSDNDSPDNTKRAFLRTPTRAKKVYLSSRGRPRRLRGKGFNMRLVFEYARGAGAKAVGFIDGDVRSATPEWVRRLIAPVLEGYDHVFPIYLRNEYDGSITNHLAFPVLYGLLHTDIRQPLAGEIGISRQAIDVFLSERWPRLAFHYGIDIFMATESIFHDLRIAQTFLGTKEHKPSAPKLEPMFREVADLLFRQLKNNSSFWKKKRIAVRRVPTLVWPRKSYHPPHIAFDYKLFKELILEDHRKHHREIHQLFKPFVKTLHKMFLKRGRFNMTAALWGRIVFYLIRRGKRLSRQELSLFRILFFMRFLTFYEEFIDCTHLESEKGVAKQARLFRRIRSLAL